MVSCYVWAIGSTRKLQKTNKILRNKLKKKRIEKKYQSYFGLEDDNKTTTHKHAVKDSMKVTRFIS